MTLSLIVWTQTLNLTHKPVTHPQNRTEEPETGMVRRRGGPAPGGWNVAAPERGADRRPDSLVALAADLP